jgi:hypothetical protein
LHIVLKVDWALRIWTVNVDALPLLLEGAEKKRLSLQFINEIVSQICENQIHQHGWGRAWLVEPYFLEAKKTKIEAYVVVLKIIFKHTHCTTVSWL